MVLGWLGCSCDTKTDRQVLEIVPSSKRSCTDIIFLLIFLAYWGVIFAILGVAIDRGGDPDLIIRGVDYEGRICGKDTGVENQPWAALPRPLSPEIKVCFEDCAETETSTFMVDTYVSTEFVVYCIPIFNGSVSVDITVSGDFEDLSTQISYGIGDLWTSWVVIALSTIVALIMAYFYALLCKHYAGCMVWTAIVFIILGGLVLSYVLIQKADDIELQTLPDDTRDDWLRGVGYGVGATTLVFLLVVFCLRDRIRIAIAVVREAAEAVYDMKSMICFPVFPFMFACIYAVFWIVVALYIFSVGEFVDKPFPPEVTWSEPIPATFRDFEWDDQLKEAAAVHFFHLLWNVQFLIYFAYLVIAGAIADWYFTERDESGNKKRGDAPTELTHSPVRASCWRTFRFHLGTIAVGSLIIAIIQAIRIAVKYIEEKSKAAGEPNQLQKFLFCCFQCCLKCAECCLDKVNKNAFVWCAIFGDSFGTAACSSFSLIWRNLARVAAINIVGAYLLILGKVVVALCTTGLCAGFLAYYPYYDENLSSIIVPCLVIFILSFMVASLFMSLFETTIDATFLCFLIDEEANEGKHRFASERLEGVVNRFAAENEAKAKREKTLKGEELQSAGNGGGAGGDGGNKQLDSQF